MRLVLLSAKTEKSTHAQVNPRTEVEQILTEHNDVLQYSTRWDAILYEKLKLPMLKTTTIILNTSLFSTPEKVLDWGKYIYDFDEMQ